MQAQTKRATRATKATATGTKRGTPERAQPYLSPEGLRFLRGLARHNDRVWFNERKPIFEAEVKRPMLALIEAVTGAMMDFAPAHVRAPESILMRIYRDTRFAKDKSPYKTHMSGWWVHDGLMKTSGAGYYLQISGKEVMIAFGAYMPDPEQLLAIRRHLLEHHEEYRKLEGSRPLRRLFPEEENGDAMARAPKGFPVDHPAIDLIRQRRWGRSVTLSSDVATRAELVDEISQRFRAAAPLVALLNRPLLQSAQRPRKPLF